MPSSGRARIRAITQRLGQLLGAREQPIHGKLGDRPGAGMWVRAGIIDHTTLNSSKRGRHRSPLRESRG